MYNIFADRNLIGYAHYFEAAVFAESDDVVYVGTITNELILF